MEPEAIFLSPEAYDEFVTKLDAPAQEMPKLQVLFSEPSPWKQSGE